ncbi:hypothetical protein [Puniceibacterium sediminis]|nr:hypothetical protein [Puniceibacterium sediminis]
MQTLCAFSFLLLPIQASAATRTFKAEITLTSSIAEPWTYDFIGANIGDTINAYFTLDSDVATFDRYAAGSTNFTPPSSGTTYGTGIVSAYYLDTPAGRLGFEDTVNPPAKLQTEDQDFIGFFNKNDSIRFLATTFTTIPIATWSLSSRSWTTSGANNLELWDHGDAITADILNTMKSYFYLTIRKPIGSPSGVITSSTVSYSEIDSIPLSPGAFLVGSIPGPSPVPLPASLPALLLSLASFTFFKRRKSAA